MDFNFNDSNVYHWLLCKRHTNPEYVKTNTVVTVDTVQVDSMRNNTTIIPIEIIDTLQTNM